jgi:gliding motility-associated-like protein
MDAMTQRGFLYIPPAMKAPIFLLILSINTFLLQSQNLIPNPSFEEYSHCPSFNVNNIENVLFWYTPTYSTDWFHPCATNSFWSVPENINGYQEAQTGVAYAGIYVYGNPIYYPQNPEQAGKEYLSNTLISSMEKDSVYWVRLFASAAEDNVYACDCLEVWLTDYLVEVSTDSFLIEGNPQLATPEGYFLTETLEWMELCWLYKAQGGEQYMIIGSFKGNTSINTIMVDSVVSDANIYFYIEDVSIEKAPFHLVDLALGEDRIECDPVFSDTLTAGGIYENYLWSTGDTTQSIVVTEPGLYWVEGSSGGMCSMRDTIQVVYLDIQTLSLEPDLELCPQDFPYLLEGPDYMESYWWSTGDTTAALAIGEAGVYALQASHACGVFADTVIVNELAPAIDLGADTVYCGQASFAHPLAAPGGYDAYLWSTGGTAQSITATAPGVYWVQAANACGEFSDTIGLLYQPLLELDLGPDTARCLEEGYALGAGPGFDYYLWNTGATSPSITASAYGLYAVEAGYVCGVLQDTAVLLEPPAFWLSLPADTTIRLGSGVWLQASAPASAPPLWYEWTPAAGLSCTDCPIPYAAPVQNTTYTVEAQNGYGCRAWDEITLHVENPARVYIPNTFSPNGDGINDRFGVYVGPEVEEVLTLEVYDRWGGLSYRGRNLRADGTEGWDGRISGTDAVAGVYVYSAEIVFRNGEVSKVSGEVVLMR